MKRDERVKLIKSEAAKEGKIVEIIKNFFLLGKTWPEDYTLKDILEEEFDVDNRSITLYMVKESFRLQKALYWMNEGAKIQGVGSTFIKPKTLMIVREDKRNPDFVDVQFKGGRGDKDQVFTIPFSEWQRVKPRVRKKR